VEGDDGLFLVTGQPATPEDFSRLGFEIKVEYHNRLGEAGFCQIYHSEETPGNLIDPVKAIVRFGWTMSVAMHGGVNVLRGLARSKALSLLCEAPTCPVVGAIALWVLRMTEGVTIKRHGDENLWRLEQQKLSNVDECKRRALRGPDSSQREFVHRKWGLRPSDQVLLERYFDSMTDLKRIAHPVIRSLLVSGGLSPDPSRNHDVWVRTRNEFVVDLEAGTPWRW
jgi:hypothetical protein